MWGSIGVFLFEDGYFILFVVSFEASFFLGLDNFNIFIVVVFLNWETSGFGLAFFIVLELFFFLRCFLDVFFFL